MRTDDIVLGFFLTIILGMVIGFGISANVEYKKGYEDARIKYDLQYQLERNQQECEELLRTLEKQSIYLEKLQSKFDEQKERFNEIKE